MLWVIDCIARPNIDKVREPAREPHKHFLNARLNDGTLVLSGSSFDHDGKTRIGSVYIVNVSSYREARAFYDAEPFAQAGVYASVTIRAVKKSRWNPAAADSAEGRGDRPAP
jgi:uncharacterized protein